MTLGEPGLAGLVQQLAGDAREVASAEIEVHKARLTEKVTRYKGAAIYFAIARSSLWYEAAYQTL